MRAQAPHVTEHVVVDGGSTDGTLAILERQADGFMRFTSERDRGIADAFNKGIRQTTGAWVGIINSDDWYEEGGLAHYAALPEFQRDDTILHGRVRLWEEDGATEVKVLGRLDYDPGKHLRPYRRMPGYHQSCLVPRAVYDRLGLFSESYRLGMDYDFLFRCWRHGVKFRYVPEIIANYRRGGRGGRNRPLQARERLATHIVNGGNIPYAFAIYLGELWKITRKGRWKGANP